MSATRRAWLARAAALAAFGTGSGMARAQDGAPAELRRGLHLVLLGTMAGPVLDPARMMASQLLYVDGHAYLIDCGYGAIARMTELGIRLPEIDAVFITHHHSDHNADYPSLVNLAWILGLRHPMRVFGPPPMRRIHQAALDLQREDIDIRIHATGRQPIERSFEITEVTDPGPLWSDSRVRVSAARAVHPPFELALALRFDTAYGAVVFSGDTAPADTVVELARDAHTLVHEAMYPPAIDAMLARRPYVPPGLREFLLAGHTSAEDCGRIAARAGVRRLVLTHLLPGDGSVPDAVWRAEAARHFGGEIVVGRDRMVL